jgi:hydroxymethylpyrimidine pyrophosphatase-like HAD family hydrolase
MYKMVFLDIDGTILTSEGKLDRELVAAVDALKRTGILVGLATGRSLAGSILYGEKLGCSLYVTYNGSYVVDHGREIHDKRIPAQLAFHLCEKTLQANGTYVHFCKNTARSNHPPTGVEHLLPEAVPCDIADTYCGAHRLTLYVKPEHRKNFAQEMVEAVSYDEGDRLEVYPEGSKWTGILPLLNRYGISPEEVVAIGNGMNDAEMLEAAGLGIAMGNAPDEVKAKADWVTLDNDQQGAAVALKKLFRLSV